MEETKMQMSKKLVYISVFKDGTEVIKSPVRSMEQIIGMSQLVDDHTSVTLAVV